VTIIGNGHMTTMGGLDIVQQLLNDKPTFHLGGEARWDALPGTLNAICRSVERDYSTIETGVGASTVVFAAQGSYHTAISPDPAEHQRVRDYCRRIGVDDSRISFVEGLSDDVLPALLGRDRTLDVGFIDGAHSFPFPEVDWYYITRSLKVGGTLLLDDIPIPAVADLFRHMTLEPNWRLDSVFDDRSAEFTLLAPPGPENWPDQPYNQGYPDFGFAEMPRRLRLTTGYRVKRIRRRVSQRYPALRRAYRSLR
jgi:Methyltransferase domain